MMIIAWLKQSKIILFFRILLECISETLFCTKYIANSNRDKNVTKFQTNMMIAAHSLEKGMSIGRVKVGFGKNKALALIEDLKYYMTIGGDISFVGNVCSILLSYIKFNEELGADMSDVKFSLDELSSIYPLSVSPNGGVLVQSDLEIKKTLDSSFDIFSQSRFSIRDFGNDPLNLELVIKSLKLCERTPSACNRQSWRIHVYTDKNEREKLFSLQGGCKGFIEEMQCAILICGDMSLYNINEIHQVYVDGGLYAMNLLYALHYHGLATIPLTMGHKARKIKDIKRSMSIGDQEVPILLIGVGTCKHGTYRVAVSHRYDFNKYTTFQ